MGTVLRLALREIRNHPRFSVFFTLNLALGFAGFVALDAFERSISVELHARSRAFLGADIAVSAGRPLGADEEATFDALAGPDVRTARGAELLSMAAGPRGTRMIELQAIEPAFPLHGDIVLEDLGPARGEVRARLGAESGAWVDPPLLSQLGIAVGDVLRIGYKDFTISGVVARDGGRASAGFSIAPRVYVSLEHLDATGLVATGSRVRHRRLYALGPGADVDSVAQAMRRANSDARVGIRSHTEATQDLTRMFGVVADYLGLVSLVAVFLAGLGAAYLFRAFLARRVSEVAILLSLGATRGRAQLVFLVQLAALSVAAAALACGLGALLLPAVVAMAAGLAPPGFAPRVGLEAFVVTAILATLGSASACLPLLARLRRLRPAELFAEQAAPTIPGAPLEGALVAPGLVFLWGVAVWRAESLWVGSLFAGVVVAALLLLAGIGWTLLSTLARAPSGRWLPLRLALRELVRRRASNVPVFVALALCALLVSVPPQMRGVLEGELETPETSELPSLFLFDIQPDQVDALKSHVAAEGVPLERLSPMVRAQLAAIRGEPIGRDGERVPTGTPRTREQEQRRLRTRRYNLTYRPALTPSERLRAGRDFAGPHDAASGEPAELSLEYEFAEHLGLDVGDTMTFDVQGVPVRGRVVNLREVRWQSFQPNFFVAFPEGVLEAAPAIFLASVPRLPGMDRQALQDSIVAAFPNVSVVDVTRAVERVLGLVVRLHWAISSTASLSLLVGLVLVYAIARDRARTRRWETNLLKVLGAEFAEIRRAVDLEFGLLAGLAAAFGALGGVAAASLLCRNVLDVPFTPSLEPLAWVMFGVPLVCVATGRAASRSVLRERPLALLQASPAA
jgi:putative ABC transport system permease protein